jgi:PAS domain S-box-containing protein
MSQFSHGAKDVRLWQAFTGRTYTETLDQVPLIKRVLEGREPAVIDEGSIALLPARWIKPFGISSLLAVPLVSKENVLGLMALDHTEPGRRFTDEQLNLAATISSQVTIAIENARLYEETIEEKERTETVVEQAFAGIMVVDPQARILALNPEVQAITGYTSEELLGRRLAEVFGPGVSSEGSPLSEVMITGERVPPAEATLVGKNGARDILLGVTPMREGYLLNFSDITRLKEVDRLKSSFVANVSHELRAPLASIKAYTELLLDNLEGEDEQLRCRFLSIIDQEADWLAELINDLLDLSRLESEQYAVRQNYLSLNEIIAGVVALLDHQIQRRGVEVNLKIPDDLPLLLADKELLTILIRNLISNAVKFSLEGGQVDLTACQSGDSLVVEVTDQGIGIPPEDLPRLFTKFYRSSLAKESGIRGTGLGLALVKEAVELHHGAVEVTSEPGVGTRLTVTLPILGTQTAKVRVQR